MATPEMPTDTEGKRLWVMWAVLNKLITETSPERPLIPSLELRQFTLRYLDNNKDRRDDILRTLRDAGAIDLVNKWGGKNKKYFITRIGMGLHPLYRRELNERR